MKWVSIVALLLAAALWRSTSSYRGELNVLVCGAAAVILVQAVQTKKHLWAGGLSIALVFNPAISVSPLIGGFSFSLALLAIAPFAISVVALRRRPFLSIPSITDRNPGSQPL